MPTGSKKVNVFLNRLLSRTAIKENFLEYLVTLNDEAFSSLLQGTSGTLDSDKVGLVGTGPNAIGLDVSLANKVVVGTGQILTLDSTTNLETIEVPFENANGITYSVGVKYASVEADTDLNPRRGTPEYKTLLDTIGDSGNPDSVTVTGPGTGSNIRLVINSLLESGVNHAGRLVRVWLQQPAVGVDSEAIKEFTSQYDAIGGDNYIDIPYSVANPPLGQDVSANQPSSTPTDYKCLVKGISIRRNTDLSLDSDYAFIGTVEGNDTGGGATPITFNLTNQVAVFLITLDRAYDGIGAGAGNFINVDVDGKPFQINSFPADTALRPDLKYAEKFTDPNGAEIFRMEQFGRRASTPRHKDDFMYSPEWADAATRPQGIYNAFEFGGAATRVRIHPQTGHPLGGHGVLEMITDINATDEAFLSGPLFTVLQRFPRMYVRAALRTPQANWRGRIALATSLTVGAGKGIGFEFQGDQLVGWAKDGATILTPAALRTIAVPDLWYDMYFVVLNATTVAFWVGRSLDQMTTPVVLDISTLSWDFSNLAGDDRFFFLAAQGRNDLGATAATSTMLIDFWETWLGAEIRTFLP